MNLDWKNFRFDRKKISDKMLYIIAGGTMIAASVGAMIAYLARRKEEREVGIGMLLGGIAGLTVGAFLAYEPARRARSGAVVEQMFDDTDAADADRRVREVLNKTDETASSAASPRRAIEVDDEATEADFT